MASRLIQASPEDGQASETVDSTHPEFELPDASFLLYGTLEQEGFDLVITNPVGEVVIVHDYFSFTPPPNLVIASGAGLSPEMVRSLMPQSFGDEVLFAGPAGSGATAIEIGTVTLLFGDVRVKHADSSEEKLSRGDTLYKGDVIITGARAFVKVKMLDGTRFHLGKNGEASLDDFQFDPAAKIGTFVATVRVGGFHYKSGKIGKLNPSSTDSHSTIKTPSAIVGIHGSELDGTVDIDGKTIIIHRSGYLQISDINGENIVILEFPGNTSVIVLDGGPAFFLKPTSQHAQELDNNLPPVDTPEEIAEQEAEDQTAEGQGEDGESDEEEGETEEGDEDPDTASGEDAGEEEDGSSDDEESETEDPADLGSDRAPFVDPLDNPDVGAAGEEEGSGVLETLDPATPPEEPAAPEESTEEVREQEDLPPDNAPEALDDIIISTTSEPIDLGELILANDTDSDPDQEPELSTVTALNGTGTLEFDPETNRLTYTPDEDVFLKLDEGETLQETFSYTIVSGGLEDTASVTILLIGANDKPIAEDDIADTPEDNVLKLEVLENDKDPDPDDVLIITEVDTENILGIVSIEEDGEFLNYFPPQVLSQGEVRVETFSYTISDGDVTTTASVTVTVTGANDPPVISTEDPVEITASNEFTEILLSDIFSDSDLGSTLTVVEVDQSLTKGTIVIGSIFYLSGDAFAFLKAGEIGTDSFFIKVQDEFGATGSGTYTIEIVGVNDAPVVGDDSYTLDSGSPLVVDESSGLLANDSDPESENLEVDLSLIEGPANGALVLNTDGSFTYTPNENFSGVDNFVYVVSDPQGLASGGLVTLSVAAPVNFVPTGSITITGTPIVGEVLNAVSTLVDANGLGSLSYQWLSNGVVIPNAISSSYIVSPDDIDSQLTVLASYLDGDGFSEAVTSSPIDIVSELNNLPTGVPLITGLTAEGQVLTADTSNIADLDGPTTLLFTYQWFTGATPISGATSSSYLLVTGDVGTTITVQVSYTDSKQNIESVDSLPTTPITVVPNNLPTGIPVIVGAPVDGQTLAADINGVMDLDGLNPLSFTFQWFANSILIPGATSASYLVGTGDVGATITVRFDYLDLNVNPESVTSAPTPVVIPFTGAPFIEVAAPGPFVAVAGEFFETQTDFGELDGDTLSYTVSGLPAGLSFTTDTVNQVVTISGTPTDTGTVTFNVAVTATDPDGAATDSFALAVQQPQPTGIFAGPGPYTFINGFEDNIIGLDTVTENLHTIIFSGTAEPGDSFVQADGQFQLLLDNFGNDLIVINSPGIVGGTGIDNITIQGDVMNPFNILNGLGLEDTIINLTYLAPGSAGFASSVINQGTIDIFDATVGFGGGFTQFATGELLVSGNSAAGNFSVAGNTSNLGEIILHSNGFAAALTVDPGSPFNSSGEIFSVGSGAPNLIGADLSISGGSLFVAHDLTFINGPHVLDFSGGTVDVAFGSTLEVQGGSVVLGNSTAFEGDGVVRVTGTTPTILLSGGLDLFEGGQVFDFSSPGLTFNNVSASPELLRVGSNTMLTLDAATVNTNLENNGKLTFINTGNQVSSASFNNLPGAVLEINGFSGTAGLAIAGPGTTTTTFTNNGKIIIDNFDTGGSATTLSVFGSLQNNGEILVRASGGGGDNHVLNAELSNLGTLRLEANLDLLGSFDHVSNGVIYLQGADLDITSAGSFSSFGVLTGNGTINNAGMPAPFLLNGVVRPDSTFTGTATITFTGDVDVGPATMFELDIAGPTSFDKVVVATGSLAFTGSPPGYNLTFLPGHGVGNSNTLFGVISAPSFIGTTTTTVSHNLGAAYTLTAAIGGFTITDTVDITVTSSFDTTFTDGNANGFFLDALNWSPAALPAPPDNVLVDSFSIVTLSGVSSAVNSLSLQGFAFFTIASGGSLALNQASMFQDLTVFTLEAGGELQVDSILTNNGTFTWSGGMLTDPDELNPPTSIVSNYGTIDIDTTADPKLDLTIENHGNLNIDGASGSLATSSAGSGLIENFGFISAIQSQAGVGPEVGADINNHPDAFIDVNDGSSTGTTSPVISFSGTIINDGTLMIANFDAVAPHSVTLDISAGSLVNNGILGFDDFSGLGVQTLQVGSTFVNTGLVDVIYSGTINGSGFLLDNSGGSLNVGLSQTLTLSDSITLKVDEFSQIEGSGSIVFTGAPTLFLLGDASISIFDFNLGTTGSFVSTISGGGFTLFIEPGAALTLNSLDVVSSGVFLLNEGIVNLTGEGVMIQGAFENLPGATLDIINVGATGTSISSFSESFDNDGVITLRQAGTASNGISINELGSPGTLTNNDLFFSEQIGSSLQPNLFQGIFDNRGDLHVDYSLELNAPATVTHINGGVFHIPAGQTLTLGPNNSLLTTPGSDTHGFGTIDVSAPGVVFNVHGILQPGEVGMPGILTVLGDTQLQSTAEVIIEVFDTLISGSDFNVLALGNASLKGKLKVVTPVSFFPSSGSPFSIITAVSLLGSFDTVYGLDFDPSGAEVFDYDQSASQIDLTIRNVDILGTAASDVGTLVGTATTGEIFHGLGGNDELLAVGPGDTAYGGPGDDEFFVSPGFKRIDGGDGFDVVENLQSVDYRTVEGHVFERIEAISIEDGTPQLLEFDAAAISRIVDADQQFSAVNSSLAILGDSEDKVILHGDFFENGERVLDLSGGSVLFQVFTEGDVSLLVNEFLELEIQRTDGSVGRYGNSNGELLTGTGLNDTISGRFGDDTLDGQGGADVLEGGPGNDTLKYDPADIFADGGDGVDSLLISGLVDLSGVSNLANLERLDMTNGMADTLTLDISDVLNMVGDNSLDALLPGANTKMLIEGDASDTVNLDGVNISDMASALPANVDSDFMEIDIFGTGELYIKFVDSLNNIDLYIHSNLVDDTPIMPV